MTKSLEFGVFSKRVVSGGYLCGLRPILSYELKQSSSGFTQFIGRFCNNLQILEVSGQLFVNVVKDTYFQFSVTYKYCYMLNNIP